MPKTTGNKSSRKKQCMSAVLPEIKEILEKRMGTSLSDIRDTVNEDLDKNFLNNNKIKMFLTEMIGDDIQFCKLYAKNQSLLIFSAKLSMQDIVQRLQSINMYKEVASNLGDILLPTSFDIDDKFGDANELEHSWEFITIPKGFAYFFSTLFKLYKSEGLYREDLARYSVAESKNCHIPLPSQFTKENFAFAAFDNFDHQDQSATSGKFSNPDTVMTLY